MTNPDNPNIINFDLWKQAAGGRHQIGTLAGFKSEQVAGFLLECMAGFVGIRTRVIEEVRSVTADPVIIRQNWLQTYEFVTDKGALALNDYARASDPFGKVGWVQVATDVSSVIRASGKSFRVAWTERRYENGALTATERWTAILTVVVEPPRDAERLRKNPLGVFIHAINWSKELG